MISWSLGFNFFGTYRTASKLYCDHKPTPQHGNPRCLSSKEPACNAEDTGDIGSIPGSGRSPGGGNGNPLQHFCLVNPMDRGAWRTTIHRITKIQTQLSNWAHTYKQHQNRHGYLTTLQLSATGTLLKQQQQIATAGMLPQDRTVSSVRFDQMRMPVETPTVSSAERADEQTVLYVSAFK